MMISGLLGRTTVIIVIIIILICAFRYWRECFEAKIIIKFKYPKRSRFPGVFGWFGSYFNWTLDKTVFEDNISKCFPYLGIFDPHNNQSSADFEDSAVVTSQKTLLCWKVSCTLVSRRPFPPCPVLFAGICCFMHPVNLLLKLRLFYWFVNFALLLF